MYHQQFFSGDAAEHLLLVTANAFVMAGLRAHGRREVSRVNILPVTEEKSLKELVSLDEEMMQGCWCLASMVRLGDELASQRSAQNVTQISEGVARLIPRGDTVERIANNYAILIQSALLVITSFISIILLL